MIRLFSALLVAGCLLACTSAAKDGALPLDLTQWVDPLIGTETSYALSGGNTYPAASRPWGQTSWSPQTGGYASGLFYEYGAQSINGIRATHQASVWMSDYGDFSLMAVTGEPGFLPDQRATPFSHEHESSRPQSYSVALPRYGLQFGVAPTSRAAVVQIESADSDTVTLIVDPHPPGNLIEILPAESRLRALTVTRTDGAPENFKSFMVARFDRAPVAWGTWTDSSSHPNTTRAEGDHSGAWIRFAGVRDRPLTLRVGTSFISAAQAELNLSREVEGKSFDEIRMAGRRHWNRLLQRASVEGGTAERRTVFYTALYRSLLFPRDWHETDHKGQMIHFSPYDGKIHAGPMVADIGLWDAYRSHVPLHFLLYPERAGLILRSLLNAYTEGGWFPKWLSPGYRRGMPGTQAEIIFADAWFKGVRDFDANLAYEGLLKNGTEPGDMYRGRLGLASYERLGFVANEVAAGAVSRTLQFAYADFCLARLAGALGHSADSARFQQRSANWRNVFDDSTGFPRGRAADASWMALDPYEWGGPFVEGSPWQYRFAVPHDVAGLAELLGGRQGLATALDSLYKAPPTVHTGSYGRIIHEMKELIRSGIGQYAHGNQPSHHVPYLYNYTDSSWKTAPLVRRIGDEMYQATPDGYSGDEDTGSLGSWYVFTALGLYPVVPGTPSYALGAPRFPRATLLLENDRVLTIEAPAIEASGAIYLQSVFLNGERLHAPFVQHEQLLQGGTLRFNMGKTPNPHVFEKKRGHP